MSLDDIKDNNNAVNDADVWTFNVGGTLFQTTSATLLGSTALKTKRENNWFSALPYDRRGTRENPIFVDRDPACFSILLDCLRTGRVHSLAGIPEVRLRAAFDYFNVPWPRQCCPYRTEDGAFKWCIKADVPLPLFTHQNGTRVTARGGAPGDTCFVASADSDIETVVVSNGNTSGKVTLAPTNASGLGSVLQCIAMLRHNGWVLDHLSKSANSSWQVAILSYP